MVSDAQKRANAEYQKKTKVLSIRFYPTGDDFELLDYIRSKENTAAYIKELVRRERNREL